MFAERVKLLRLERKMTQKQLGELLGVTPVTIGDYERDTKKPRMDSLERLAGIFNVSTDYLTGNSNSRKLDNTNKDIKIELDKLQEMLESQRGLMFDGEPLDDTTKFLLLEAIKSNCTIHKKLQKEREGKK